MGRIEDLPPKALDAIIEALHTESPEELVANVLGSLSKPIHQSACRAIFGNPSRPLVVPDDARLFDKASNSLILSRSRNPAIALVLNPARYGPYVKSLRVGDPNTFAPLDAAQSGLDEVGIGSSNLGLFDGDFEVISEEEEDEEHRDDEGQDGQTKSRRNGGDGQVRPIDGAIVKNLLSTCEELEKLEWTSSYPPPDGLFEDLVSYNPKVNCFAYKPSSRLLSSSSSSNATKWDAPSLPLLSPLISSFNLTDLTLTRLTQTGAISLALLLDSLAEESEHSSSSSASGLQSLELNFVWVDDPLCQRIVRAGKRTIRKLTMGTQGTKLTDVGVLTLLEGLDVLEEFGLVDVEGRLSKTLWTKLDPETISPSLSKLTIGIPDVGPSHSWSLDHLQSLPSFPWANIRHLSIVRTSTAVEGPSIDKGNNLQPVPREMLKALVEGRVPEITCLECDWWGWSPEDLKAILERSTHLKALKVAFDAPFTRFLGLASSIASASNLGKIAVLIPAEHAPSLPPSPSVATPGNLLSPSGSPMINFSSRTQLTPLRGSVGLPPSPSASTVLRRDSMSKSYTAPSSLPSGYFSADPAQSSPSTSISGSPLISLNGSLPSLDPALPLTRDMKKLFKRCPVLREVEWVGRGLWVLDPTSRSSTAKTVSLASIKVEFYLPRSLSVTAYEEEYERKRLEEEAMKWRWYPSATDRVGQEWSGGAADDVAKGRERLLAEKEKEKEGAAELAGNGKSPVRRRAPTLPSGVVSPPPSVPSQAKQAPSALENAKSGSGKHGRPSGARRTSLSLSAPKNAFEKPAIPTLDPEGSASSSASSQSLNSLSEQNVQSEPSASAPAEIYQRPRGGHGGRGRGRPASDGERRQRGSRNGGVNEGHSRTPHPDHVEHRRDGHGRGSHRKPGSSNRGHTVFIGSAHNKRSTKSASTRTATASSN